MRPSSQLTKNRTDLIQIELDVRGRKKGEVEHLLLREIAVI